MNLTRELFDFFEDAWDQTVSRYGYISPKAKDAITELDRLHKLFLASEYYPKIAIIQG